jgi:hypothetical protein
MVPIGIQLHLSGKKGARSQADHAQKPENRTAEPSEQPGSQQYDLAEA